MENVLIDWNFTKHFCTYQNHNYFKNAYFEINHLSKMILQNYILNSNKYNFKLLLSYNNGIKLLHHHYIITLELLQQNIFYIHLPLYQIKIL